MKKENLSNFNLLIQCLAFIDKETRGQIVSAEAFINYFQRPEYHIPREYNEY